MAYTPKHAAARRTILQKVGVGIAGVATATAVGVGMATPASADTGVWDRLAQCEAGGNWHINTGNGFYGGLQFTIQSWYGAGGGAYASRPDLASREQQIAAGQRLLAMQGPGAWPVCSVRAGLTRASGGSGGAAPAPVAAVAPQPAKQAPQSTTQAAQQPAEAPAPAAAPVPAAPPKPAAGALLVADTNIVQNWTGLGASGGWDKEQIAYLQAKLGTPTTGRTDVAMIAAAEKLVGVTPSGLDYFTQPVLEKLAAHAKGQLNDAALKSLAASVEGGNVSMETLALAAQPASYR